MSTILLVDDNPADRALFRVILGRAGFVVHELAMGKDVPAKAKTLRPHLIVLDINLPDINGHDICRALKADPETAGIPVLMLTVRQHEADVIAGLDAGADDYVAKDEPPPIILARMQRLVRYRQMAQSSLVNEQLAQVGRLLAGIVHEIRGPLSVLRGHAELLHLLTQDQPKIHEWVEPILRNAKVMQVRLTHLMAAVKTRSNRTEQFNLIALIREAVDLFEKGYDPNVARPKVRIESQEPGDVLVRFDPGRILLVLLNLLNNADEALREAHRTDGQIRIKLARCVRDGTRWVRLDVSDNGQGIPEALIDRIMEPFFTTKPEGSGYGLYLSSEILTEMGGRMEASNLPDGGACFTLWFPDEADAHVEFSVRQQSSSQPTP